MIPFAKKSDIPQGHGKRFVINGHAIAVFHTLDDQFFALDDRCSHAQASLSRGAIIGNTVECPRHGSQFDLRTGKNCSLPATKPVRSYSVIVRGDDLFLEHLHEN